MATDIIFIEMVSLLMDTLSIAIDDESNDLLLENKLKIDTETLVTDLVDINEIINKNEVKEILKDYLDNVTIEQFIVDFIKCKSGFIMNISEIYKCIINKKNNKVIMKNYRKNIINKDIAFVNNNNLVDGKLYILKKNGEIKPSLEYIDEFTVDFINEKIKINNLCDNMFWFMYYLADKHKKINLISTVRQNVYNIDKIYGDTINIKKSVMSNLVDMLGEIPINTFNIRKIEKSDK
jgi:hypothetical protein